MPRPKKTLHKGLKLTPPGETHWHLGSGKARQRFGAAALNSSADYAAFVPAFEAQSRPGFDTDGCAVFGTLKAYITLARFKGYTDFTPDASERYTGAWAGTTEEGTDPHVVAETIRSPYGLVPQETMPWTTQRSLPTYYDHSQALANWPLGKALLRRFQFGHEWVFAFGSSHSPEDKQQLLKQALARGTVCVSVSGNYRTDADGRLFKKPGEGDSHWVMLTRFNGPNAVIDDQYDPFVRELAANYDHQAAKVYFLQRLDDRSTDIWSRIWSLFAKLWRGS